MLFYFITALILLFFFLYPKSKWEAAVALYVAFILQSAVLGEGDQLLGFIDHRSLVAIIIIYSAFSFRTLKIHIYALDIYKKLTIFLAIFLVVLIQRYIEIKGGILFGGLDIGIQIKRFLRDSIYIYSLYLIVIRMYDVRTLKGLENGLFIGVGISVISVIFLDFFINAGFMAHKPDFDKGEQIIRASGFLGANPNPAAGYMNVVFGYLLAKNEYTRKFSNKHILLIFLIIISLLLYASKTGLITFIALTLLYLFKNSKSTKKRIGQGFLIFLVSILLFNYFGDTMEKRVEQQVSGEFDSLESRQSYWQIYINDIIKNPEYLLIGNLGKPTHHRNVHNTYIEYLFYAGLIVFTIILSVFWNIFKYRNLYKGNYAYYTPIYSLLALMLSWITGAGQINFWFLLIIAASTGIPNCFAKLQTHNYY